MRKNQLGYGDTNYLGIIGVIANGLGGPEGYLRYLAIQAMNEQAHSANSTTVYVPTEAGIPITEAARFNRPAAQAE